LASPRKKHARRPLPSLPADRAVPEQSKPVRHDGPPVREGPCSEKQQRCSSSSSSQQRGSGTSGAGACGAVGRRQQRARRGQASPVRTARPASCPRQGEPDAGCSSNGRVRQPRRSRAAAQTPAPGVTLSAVLRPCPLAVSLRPCPLACGWPCCLCPSHCLLWGSTAVCMAANRRPSAAASASHTAVKAAAAHATPGTPKCSWASSTCRLEPGRSAGAHMSDSARMSAAAPSSCTRPAALNRPSGCPPPPPHTQQVAPPPPPGTLQRPASPPGAAGPCPPPPCSHTWPGGPPP